MKLSIISLTKFEKLKQLYMHINICCYGFQIKIHMNQNPKEPSLAISHHKTENIKDSFN